MEPQDPAPPAKNSDNDQTTTTTARSYECIFCKRGFNNAQALGGHMNIHRKDRAKPKAQNPPTYTHFPFDIAPKVDFSIPPPTLTLNRGRQVVGSAASSPSPRQQLPLFIADESPSSSSRRKDDRGPPDDIARPGGVELDLELRLGPDRPGRR